MRYEHSLGECAPRNGTRHDQKGIAMDNKKKLAAGGAALLVGAVGYGVYATTLTVDDKTVSFAAGSGTANQVEGFGQVTINAGTPKFDAKAGAYSFEGLTITPVGDAAWSNVEGKTIKVVAYDAEGNAIGDGAEDVTSAFKGADAETVKLTKAPNANNVVTWGIVIQ